MTALRMDQGKKTKSLDTGLVSESAVSLRNSQISLCRAMERREVLDKLLFAFVAFNLVLGSFRRHISRLSLVGLSMYPPLLLSPTLVSLVSVLVPT